MWLLSTLLWVFCNFAPVGPVHFQFYFKPLFLPYFFTHPFIFYLRCKFSSLLYLPQFYANSYQFSSHLSHNKTFPSFSHLIVPLSHHIISTTPLHFFFFDPVSIFLLYFSFEESKKVSGLYPTSPDTNGLGLNSIFQIIRHFYIYFLISQIFKTTLWGRYDIYSVVI